MQKIRNESYMSLKSKLMKWTDSYNKRVSNIIKKIKLSIHKFCFLIKG